jgi:hypothetical protein
MDGGGVSSSYRVCSQPFPESMMKRSVLLLPLAAAVLALASPSLQAQDGGPPRGDRPQRFSRNPVAVLVDSAQVLGLSGDQATRVRAIAQELDARNRPALDSLERYRPRDGGGGMGGGGMGRGEMTPEMRERMQHVRPFMQQLRENNREAMDRAMALLTPEQRERAQAMLPPERMGRGGPGGPPRP